ncbi:MAG TPA: ATP-binding protein, partial [Thermoanaerobaculia bacterium]|nr:ATP-binding protein [Thermoanaerobaculia bacterium]
MHPLRVLLLASLVIAGAIAWSFGVLLLHAGQARPAAIILASLVFVAFLVPWLGVSAWAVRRASDLDRLIERTREVAKGRDDAIADRPYHGEVDDLARAIDEIRSALVRQRGAFAEHRAVMDQIVASLGEGLVAIGAQRKVVFANERAIEILGAGHDVAGKSILEIVRKSSVVSAFDRALHGYASTDRVALMSGGEDRHVEVRVFPVAPSGDIAAVALFIDITQIERLQRIRKDFLDDFSHEVRTPLAGLRSAVETYDGGELEPQQEEQLRHVMLRQLSRIERLVKDLSELNRIESGELVLERQSIDLREALRELVDDFRERLSMRVTLRGDEAVAAADPARVEQIFTNLLDNAWKHGGAGGEVLVEVGRAEDSAIVRVSDEGDGIPPHEIERIFNRFYRVDRSRSQQIPGVGLGLAITKHLVLLHGGSIRAYNRPTGGATFEVR